MKNKKAVLWIFLSLLISFCISCSKSFITNESIEQNKQEDPEAIIINGKYSNNSDVSWGYEIVTITYKGESHQYIHYCDGYRFGISHWEGCKYCKTQNSD